jgi:hypothetical protein
MPAGGPPHPAERHGRLHAIAMHRGMKLRHLEWLIGEPTGGAVPIASTP